MAATATPLLARLGLRIGIVGTSAALALAISTLPDASNRIGFYADTTAGVEKLGTVVGGVTGLTQAVSSGSVFLGIGTTSPQRKVHVSIANATVLTAMAYENTDTTDGTGVAVSFRAPTTGAGAASFQDFASLQALFPTHDHATRTGTLALFTTVAGTSAARLSINATGGVAIAALTSGRVTQAGASGLLIDDSGFTRSALALTVDGGSDGTYYIGNLKIGLATSGAAGNLYLGHGSSFSSTTYFARILATGQALINAPSGTTVTIANSGTGKFVVAGSSANFASGVPLTINDTTVSSSTTTGALICSGGGGFAGQLTGATIVSTGNLTQNSSGGLMTVNGTLLFGNNQSSYATGQTAAIMYGTNSGGGAYPFLEAGNLVISPRISGATRDVIVSVAGTAANFRFNRLGSFVMGEAALATNATDGFFYVKTCAGTPTGTPSSFTGSAAMCYDTTNHKLYVYDGGWKTTTVFA